MENQRALKFRVWDIYNKQWLFGGNSNNKCISFSCWSHNYFSVLGVSKECINVQQFTGLYDKNNKEIYEGDICLIEYYSPAQDKYIKNKDVVTFQDGCFCCKIF